MNLTGGLGPQTITSELNFTVDLTKVGSLDDLLLGLYSPTSTAGGFQTLNFDVYANGTHSLGQSFTSVSAANTYSTDHALDLGALSGGSLNLDIRLSESVKTAGSGYHFDLIAGDLLLAAHPDHLALLNAFGSPTSPTWPRLR